VLTNILIINDHGDSEGWMSRFDNVFARILNSQAGLLRSKSLSRWRCASVQVLHSLSKH